MPSLDLGSLVGRTRDAVSAVLRRASTVVNATVPAEREDGTSRRLSTLVESLDAIVWEADPRTLRYTFVSRKAETMFGVPVEQWLADPAVWPRVVHPDDRDHAVAARLAAACGRAQDFEYRAIAADGSVVWLRDIIEVIPGAGGSPARLVGLMVDVTARKAAALRQEAQHAVTRALAEAETLEEAAPRILEIVCRTLGWERGALFEVDPAGDLLRCVTVWKASGSSDAFSDATLTTAFPSGVGLPGRVWELGEPVWISDVVHDTNFPRAPVAAAAGLHGAFGFPIRVRSDVLAIMEFFSDEIRSPDEELLKMMGTIGRQIGGFIERRSVQASLRESEARKSAIFTSALDCIITIDIAGTVVEMNDAAVRTFGYTPEEAVGRRLGDLIVPPDLRAAHFEGFERYRATGEGRVLGKRLELRAMRKDGREFPVELAIVPVEIPGHSLFTGYLRDITDRAEAERSMRLANERAAFLAEATALLSMSLDHLTTLVSLAELSVPAIADWCFVDVVDDESTMRRVAAAHADPEKAALLRSVQGRYPLERLETGPAGAIATGRSQLFTAPSDALEALGLAGSEAFDALRADGVRSAMVVPLVARGRTLGTLTFVSSGSGRDYTDEDLRLAEELAGRAALAVDNARLYRERSRVARTLQESLLPPTLPSIGWAEVAGRYHASGEGMDVGGDFYDVFRTSGDSWAFALGDVCGKGADAAAVTALARYTIRAAAMQEHRPAAVLSLLNDAMLQQRTDKRYCTAVFGTIARDAGGVSVRLSCGGHPSPLVVSPDGIVRTVGEPGTLLGLFEDPKLSDSRERLAPGESLVLFTDGVSEARGAGEVFGDERLERAVASGAGLDAPGLAGLLEEEVLSFSGGRLRDDIAIVVLRVPPRAGEGEP